MDYGIADKIGGAICEMQAQIAQDDDRSGCLTMHADRYRLLGQAALDAMPTSEMPSSEITVMFRERAQQLAENAPASVIEKALLLAFEVGQSSAPSGPGHSNRS